MEFIPAQESRWFINLFKWYTWLLFKRRFKSVWLRQEYSPCSSCKTIYYLNHHSWWDGLIPLLLNEFRFNQQARAIMAQEQMQNYSFFRKIGAFSINRKDRKSAITSLRYAVQSMNRDNASLFIYPEGQITPSGSVLEFEGGLSWIYSKMDPQEVDLVPIGIHLHTIRHDKPELHLWVGRPVDVDGEQSNAEKSDHLEKVLSGMLKQLRSEAGFDDINFERLV